METSGVKQACPNFFNLFINALIENIKKLLMGELILTLFKFANDVALMAETEKDLQWMLKALHFWCECRLLRINISKTKIACSLQTEIPA